MAPDGGPETDTALAGDRERGYLFDNHHAHSHEQHRCLAAAYDPITVPRLAATGVSGGWHCLDVGSGGGSVARWLADRVAPSGSVLATDVKPDHIPPHPGVTVLRHDVTVDALPESRFDLIVARLVLQHLPRRGEALAALVRALKPGGWLQIDEFDAGYAPVLLAPSARAARLYEKFLAAKSAALRSAGGDPEWGRRVPDAMHAAGLVDIDPSPHLTPRRAGTPDLALQVHHTVHLREALLGAGMTADELAEVRDVMRDPFFRASSNVLYSVHGRKAPAP